MGQFKYIDVKILNINKPNLAMYLKKKKKDNIGFPCYLKIERSYENFCKLKWHEAKSYLPLLENLC